MQNITSTNNVPRLLSQTNDYIYYIAYPSIAKKDENRG